MSERIGIRSDVPGEIVEAIAAVEPLDPAWAERTAALQSRLTMPPGSLGRLLNLGRQLGAIQRTTQPSADPALVAVFAADHGVVVNGISAYPAEVTGQMVANYLGGGAAVNVLARRAGAEVRVVDLGVASLSPEVARHDRLHSYAIGRGTRDLLQGPAMTREEAFRAVRVGLSLAEAWAAGGEGFRVFALGEMGIGNTTAASSLLAALTDTPADRVVGRGTGVDDATYARKCRVVATAVERHRDAIHDVWDWLARLGGFEILGLAGLAIGAARARSLVVLDGLISSVAGLIAAQLCPAIRGALVASHLSPEPGHRVVLGELGLSPILDLGLRLGEGTGATLALPIIASAADILREMATFDSAGVSEANGTSAEVRLSPERPLG